MVEDTRCQIGPLSSYGSDPTDLTLITDGVTRRVQEGGVDKSTLRDFKGEGTYTPYPVLPHLSDCKYDK